MPFSPGALVFCIAVENSLFRTGFTARQYSLFNWVRLSLSSTSGNGREKVRLEDLSVFNESQRVAGEITDLAAQRTGEDLDHALQYHHNRQESRDLNEEI